MKAILAVIAAMAALTLASPPAQAQTKVNVGYTNTVGFAGLFVAKDQGFFAKRNLDVDVTLIALNSTIPSALVGGSVQVGGPTPSVLMQAVEGGLDLVIVANCSVNDTNVRDAGGVVARTGSAIKTPQDFVGKKVGVPGIGAYLHVMFRKWLKDKGVDYKKVTFLEVPFAQGSDILKAGNVDAVLTGDPFFSRIIASKTGYLVAPYLAETTHGHAQIYYAATRDWVKQNPAAAKAFKEAIAEANDFVAKKADETRTIVGKFIKLPPEVLAGIRLPTLDANVSEKDVKDWVDILIDQGMLSKPLNPTSLIVQ